MNHLFTMFDDNKRLLMVGDSFTINNVHVLADADFFSVVLELLLGRVRIPVNGIDFVGALVSPIGNDAGSNNFRVYKLLEAVITISLSLNFVNFVEASNSRHEAEERVNSDSHACLTHED